MAFKSIIYIKDENNLISYDLDLLTDLSLNDIFKGINGNIIDDNIDSILHKPLKYIENIKYRQDVFSDLMDNNLYNAVKLFSENSDILLYKIRGLNDLDDVQRKRCFLDSVYLYCNAITSLLESLKNADLKSSGFINLLDYLKNYTESDFFKSLKKESYNIEKIISSIRYKININGNKITVKKCLNDDDFSDEIINAFSKFLDDKNFDFNDDNSYEIGHVEASIIVLVSRLYPDEFGLMSSFFEKYNNFIDPVIEKFMHDIKFYLKYIIYMKRFTNYGLKFCIPKIINSGNVYADNIYDLALAQKLIIHGNIPVANSFSFNDANILIVTGPNNGGKTTFARSIGQVYYLSALGLPVPGSDAALNIPDKIFTHFEKSEAIENPEGRLEEELKRFKKIIDESTDKSVIIINEMLSSTTIMDGIEIGKKIIDLLIKRKCHSVYVTFIHELSELNGVKSYVAQVGNDHIKRAYKIIQEKSNGMAYAHALAEKYGLSYEILIKRIKNEDLSNIN
ncbi:MutS-related protein [Picrophilus oshimae]|uniref:MutS domain V n=1 Tax=Picrophilus torridus (strain ATCC 700027 / DSM 9790 / JCM 10055 / NBRC 100828 / KAW 2/3) TaxID=1122961 RepID=A0A8G2FWL2_PICTO|nr:hypothetical protein [Picrophilus oshimae]SMD30817.1 MutS domain V [Picrophilus oshimae DSM 9789]